jgi:ribonucleoside-diphosphate reductase alpha chain
MNPEIPYAKSISDYIFRWLASKFLSAEHAQAVGVQKAEIEGAARAAEGPSRPGSAQQVGSFRAQADAPPCHYCGSIMLRNGSCYRCANCGSTSGCS